MQMEERFCHSTNKSINNISDIYPLTILLMKDDYFIDTSLNTNQHE